MFNKEIKLTVLTVKQLNIRNNIHRNSNVL